MSMKTIKLLVCVAAPVVALGVGAVAPASAAPVMSGHYIETDTAPSTGQTTTTDWYFTPCGDGCASGAFTPNGPAKTQAKLVNGQWKMETGPDPILCTDGTKVPSALSSFYTWDPNTLAGTAQSTYQVPACGNAVGTQQTVNLQFRQAP
jgi:hypothetical protein